MEQEGFEYVLDSSKDQTNLRERPAADKPSVTVVNPKWLMEKGTSESEYTGNHRDDIAAEDGQISQHLPDAGETTATLPEYYENSTGMRTGEEIYACDQCDYRTYDAAELREHASCFHMGRKPFDCSQWEYKSIDGYTLNRHMEIYTEVQMFSCYLCPYRTSKYPDLERHTANHEEEVKPFDSTLFEYKPVETIEDSRQSIVAESSNNFAYDQCNYEGLNSTTFHACHLCKYKAAETSSLKNHMISCHPRVKLQTQQKIVSDEKKYTCTLCDYSSRVELHIEQHMTVHTDESLILCGQSNHDAAEEASLENNKGPSSDEGKPYACGQCSYRSAQECNVKRHMKAHKEDKPYKCDQCEYTSSEPQYLKRHMMGHKGRKPYACDECSFKTSRACALKNHVRTHFAEIPDIAEQSSILETVSGEKPFACEECSYRSKDKHKVLRHMKVHTGVRPYACDHCDYQAAERSSLKTHKLRRHAGRKPYRKDRPDRIRGTLGRKPFACNKCNYRAKMEVHIKRHMLVHTGERRYSCKYCPYRAAYSSSLKTHMYCHTGERPYTCGQCTFSTVRSFLLKKHLRKYHRENPSNSSKQNVVEASKNQSPEISNEPLLSGTTNASDQRKFKTAEDSSPLFIKKTSSKVKPYGCSLCGFRSAWKTTIHRHFKIHTGEKPYACNQCDYRAAEKQSLQTHMFRHTGERPYTCSQCTFRTVTSFLLKKHLRKYHRENLSNSSNQHVVKASKNPSLEISNEPLLIGTTNASDQSKFKTAEDSSPLFIKKTSSKVKPYGCSLCGFRSAWKATIQRHFKIHTGEKPFACNQCDYRAAEKQSLQFHVTRHHPGEKHFACNLCTFKALSTSLLKKHMTEVHGEHVSNESDQSYSNVAKSSLENHELTIAGQMYACDQCSYSSAVEQNVKRHMEYHSGNRPNKCDKCSYNTARPGNLNQHMKYHTGEKRYACQQCDYTTMNAHQLKTHMKNHADETHEADQSNFKAGKHFMAHEDPIPEEKPYACGLCSYRSVEDCNLKRHMKVHTGERPYECDKCDYRAAEKFTLKRHEATQHTATEERLFACTQCDYTAVKSRHLEAHKMTHTEGENFRCSQCDYTAAEPGLLQLHFQVHTRQQSSSVDESDSFFQLVRNYRSK